ncbi:hypothetical protein BAZ12_08830 [Elizabethkingia miricola]|uniref:FecR family protein n=1 Tax=Bacteroidota TaxID=976 RepID=UPI0009993E1C|nr:FecR family protein [Elizabethkingia miricola]OPC69916.1 hypothetical protein BAZ12_08830 [Elizabethkingia miricola]
MDEHKIFEELTIVPILTRFVRGEELTVLETKTIEIWIGASKSNREIFEQLKNEEQLAKDMVDFSSIESDNTEALQKLRTKLTKRNSRERIGMYWRTAVAVIFAFGMVAAIHYYFKSKDELQDNILITTADVSPGKDQATLTFQDGKTVDLKGKPIRTDVNGTFYTDGTSIAANTVQYATLSTPRKGQYKMTLADGTKIWLNAESSLKFPTQFTGNVRLVELIGEGYFEVAHDKSKPFFVSSRGQQVKVLGTKFNINAYENEPAILTTLVSGSVEVSTLRKDMPTKLSPGQQSQLNSLSPLFLVIDVDTEPFTAWTRNDFQFDGTPLKEVFKQLERWYDIDVDYSKMPNIKVHGTISRDKKLSTVIYALEQITNLQFDVKNGRRVVIIQ